MLLSRRSLILAAGASLAAAPAMAAAPRALKVYKTASCGCCRGWITHMSRAGFRPTVVDVEDLNPLRKIHGVPFELGGCHSAEVGGYVLEGHVPPADAIRLLREKPKAIGLSVPGMPWGSPGMEHPSGQREAFDTLLILDRNGQTRVYARHA